MDSSTYDRIKTLIENATLFNNSRSKHSISHSIDFSNEIILVTGAAGSIGKEVALQLLPSKFKQLILLDHAETPLFFLKKDIEETKATNVKFILGDIKDSSAILSIFKTYKPTIIIHTAAYKHVTLAEANPIATIKTNIFGTINLAKAAQNYNTKRFISISTDKAVEPIGVMGMTKLIAEHYLEQFNGGFTEFISARFGNIFGSNGSVVPIFLKQLQQNNSITVTHKDATRLFINKTEACSLILKLAVMPHLKYKKVAFNMEAPIKIIDLATVFSQVMINTLKTCSSSPPTIKISALAEGEKLHETMIASHETLISSSCKAIHYIKTNNPLKPLNLNTLKTLDETVNHKAIKAELLRLCKI